MKQLGILICFLMMGLMAGPVLAQDGKTDKTEKTEKKGKYETVRIKTSAECGECKERLETALAYTKGVKSSSLDPESQILEVTYRPDKITLEEIKKVVSDTGYDADDMPASASAYEKLPTCCKKGAHHHE